MENVLRVAKEKRTKMKWNKKFEYPKSIRSSVEGKRHYEITGQKLPSVTTICQRLRVRKKKAKLEEWKKRVGTQQAGPDS